MKICGTSAAQGKKEGFHKIVKALILLVAGGGLSRPFRGFVLRRRKGGDTSVSPAPPCEPPSSDVQALSHNLVIKKKHHKVLFL